MRQNEVIIWRCACSFFNHLSDLEKGLDQSDQQKAHEDYQKIKLNPEEVVQRYKFALVGIQANKFFQRMGSVEMNQYVNLDETEYQTAYSSECPKSNRQHFSTIFWVVAMNHSDILTDLDVVTKQHESDSKVNCRNISEVLVGIGGFENKYRIFYSSWASSNSAENL